MKLLNIIKGAWKALKDKLDSLIMLTHCNLIIWCDKHTGEIVSQSGEILTKPTWRNTVLGTIEMFFKNKPFITLSGIALLSIPFAWASATIAGSSIIMETLIVSSLFLMAYIVYLAMKAWDKTLDQHLAYNQAMNEGDFIPADSEAETLNTGDDISNVTVADTVIGEHSQECERPKPQALVGEQVPDAANPWDSCLGASSDLPSLVPELSTKPIIDLLVKSIKADNATKKKATDKLSPEEVYLITKPSGKNLMDNPELQLILSKHPKVFELNVKFLNSKQFRKEYIEDEFCMRVLNEVFTEDSTAEHAIYTDSFRKLLKSK